MKKLQNALLVGILVAVAVSCKKDPPEEPPVDVTFPAGSLDLGSSISADFFGRVIDENGNAVSDANVTIGSSSATTDFNGVFKIDQASVPSKLAYVKVEKDGFFTAAKSVIPDAGVYNLAQVTMQSKGTGIPFISGAATTLQVAPGVSLDLPSRYEDLAGNDYNGSITAFVSYISPEDLDIDKHLGSAYGQGADGVERFYESYGTMMIELKGNSGQDLKMAAGSVATIHMRILPSQLSNAPIGIPMVYFDKATGYWVEDGSATLNQDEYVGEIVHTEYWGMASAYSVAQVNGVVVNQFSDSISNFAIEVNTPNGDAQFYTNSNGTFNAYVPANLGISYMTIDECGVGTEIQTSGPYGTGTNNTESIQISGGLVDLIHEKGDLLDCGLANVTDGYVLITLDNIVYPCYISNGSFEVDNINCTSQSLYDVVGHDFATGENSLPIQKNITAPINDAGSSLACDSFNEYLSFSVDAGTPMEYYTDIYCAQLDTGGGWFFEIIPIDNSINIKGSVFTPGSYDYFANQQAGTIWVNPADMDVFQSFSITTELLNYGIPGQYVNLTFSGFYTDVLLVNHSIEGEVVVIRDY